MNSSNPSNDFVCDLFNVGPSMKKLGFWCHWCQIWCDVSSCFSF